VTAPVRLYRDTAGVDPATLRPGADLVLDPLPEHGLALPHGVAVDDHLDPAERLRADHEALAALAAWRAAHGPALTVDGTDLGFVWEVELRAQCFLPAARLRLALEAAGITDVTGAGLGTDLLGTVADAGVTVHGYGAPTVVAPPPRPTIPLMTQLVGRSTIPPRVRGDVLAMSYWQLEPVWERLAAGAQVRLVPGGLVLPGVGRGTALRTAARNGWSGHPSQAARRRSARRLAAALDGAAAPTDALDRAARSVLRRWAGETLARADHWRRVMASGRLQVAVLPFDSPDASRVAIAAAHAAGVTTLVVQHGFDALLGDPDKTVARHVALWSEHDVAPLRAHTDAQLHVTGNPGGVRLAGGAVEAAGDPRRAIVLVEYPSRMSARLDARIGLRHVDAALALLERDRPGTDVVVRPHPSDPAPGSYLPLGAGRDLRVSVDQATPIEPLLGTAGLCVGALSTATLQSAALGVPTVFLDVSGIDRPWPFDGAPDGLPRVIGGQGSLDAVPEAPRAAAREALGARADATERVAELISSIAAGT
jgi:hypothetical protein